MSHEVRFAGPLGAHATQGLFGGSGTLTVAAGVFVLQLARHYIYGIDELDTVRGACVAGDDGYRLEARHWHSRHDETTTVEASRPLTARWYARFAEAPAPRGEVLELAFGLAAEFFELLLLRQPTPGTSVAPALASWFEDECARRHAHAEAERERRARAEQHTQRSTESTQAFAAQDYARVESLLTPIETELSPSERQRLALARRHLGSGARG